MKGMRRDKFDTPKRDSSQDRERIASDVEKYLAAGGKVQEIPTGIGSEYLVNGVQRHLISSAQRGGERGRKARYGKHNLTKEGQV